MNTNTQTRLFAALAALAVVAASTTATSGALVAQSYDFGTDAGKITASSAGFTATSHTGRTFSDVTDAVRYTDSSGSGFNLTSTQTRSFTDLGATDHFSITLDLTHSQKSSTFGRFGILALGSGGDTGYAAAVTLLTSPDGTTGLTLKKGGLHSGGTLAALSDSALPDGTALFGVPLTLTLVGEYIGADLKLTFTVTDGTNTSSISFTDITPLTGDFAGFAVRSRDNTTDVVGSGDYIVDFDSFAIAPITVIPAPAALPAGLMMLGLVALRRRHC